MTQSASVVGKGPFFVHIEGLPRNYTWQDLKDLIREQARRGVWTDMAVPWKGERIGSGYARVQKYDEALGVYNGLRKGKIINRPLNVHLWDLSDSSPTFLDCNCPHTGYQHPEKGYWRYAEVAGNPTSWIDFTPQQRPMAYSQPRNVQYPPSYLASSASGHESQAAAYGLIGSMSNLSIAQQTANPGQNRSAPYVLRENLLPVNIANGHAESESRSIFVGNMDYKVKKDVFLAMFARAGRIVASRCETLHKGYATIRYASESAAAEAIARYNGCLWKGRYIEVRPDRNPTFTQPPTQIGDRAPINVDGSQGTARRC